MGGGMTNRPEVAKRLGGHASVAAGDLSGRAGEPDLEQPICEREQTVSFRVEGITQVGEGIRVVLADPLALVADGRRIGQLTDLRQVATLTACINDGYRFVGEVIAVDPDLGEGLALVAGVR